MVRQKPKHPNVLGEVRRLLAQGKYRITRHAESQMAKRRVTLPEVKYVLQKGRHEKAKDRWDIPFKTWNYAIRGDTLDKKDVRVIVSLETPGMVIITVIQLGK